MNPLSQTFQCCNLGLEHALYAMLSHSAIQARDSYRLTMLQHTVARRDGKSSVVDTLSLSSCKFFTHSPLEWCKPGGQQMFPHENGRLENVFFFGKEASNLRRQLRTIFHNTCTYLRAQARVLSCIMQSSNVQ